MWFLLLLRPPDSHKTWSGLLLAGSATAMRSAIGVLSGNCFWKSLEKSLQGKTNTGWWLNQPIWKIGSSKWGSSSPNRDEHKKYLKFHHPEYLCSNKSAWWVSGKHLFPTSNESCTNCDAGKPRRKQWDQVPINYSARNIFHQQFPYNVTISPTLWFWGF